MNVSLTLKTPALIRLSHTFQMPTLLKHKNIVCYYIDRLTKLVEDHCYVNNVHEQLL